MVSGVRFLGGYVGFFLGVAFFLARYAGREPYVFLSEVFFLFIVFNQEINVLFISARSFFL